MPRAGSDLRELVRATERIATEAGLHEIAARLRDDRAQRDRPGTRVAVVGDFNRGKSTLINRLIGADLLPTGNVPLTRDFVVLSAVTDGAASLQVIWPSGAAERRLLADDDPWRGLVVDSSSQVAEVGEGQAGPEEPRLLVSAPSPWLASCEVELIDTQGLHEGRVDHLLKTSRAVAVSDVVVMAISAPSPLSLLEREFLAEELLTKRVPHIIAVLTKLDQLPPAEIADFSDWFKARVADVSPSIEVLPGPGLAPAGAAELAALRDRITELARAEDVIRLRNQRLAWQLAQACAAIDVAAQAALDQLAAAEEVRHAAILAAKQELDDDALRWNQLRLELDERRLRFTEVLQGSVLTSTSELFETLDLELSRVSDIRAWWASEIPVRMRRELKTLTYSLEAQISRTISADLGWLASAIASNFSITPRPAGARRRIPISASEIPELELDDVRRRRMITRIVTATGGIVGAAIAFVSGVGMPVAFTIGGSAIAAIMAERNADAKLEDQRTVVRGHLRGLLDDVVAQYQAKLAAEVDRSYRVAFDDMKDAEASWRTARFEAIASASEAGPDATAWTAVKREVAEIVSQIPADADAGSAPKPELVDLDDVNHIPGKETSRDQ